MEDFKALFNSEPKEQKVLFDKNNFGSKRIKKEINRDIVIVKLKMFLLTIKHLPTLILKFIENSLFSLAKLWGAVLLIILLGFLYITNGYSMLYYKASISLEKSKIERIRSNIIKEKSQLRVAEKNVICYKNQFTRIVDDKIIDLNYCKHSN